MSERWEMLDHACRYCYGRLLRTTTDDGSIVVRCSECETEVRERVENLCACGAKLRSGRLAGLKCQVNPSPTIAQPARIVVVFAGEDTCRD